MNIGKLRMTCLDCGHHRMVSRNELNRAARVRCLDCGGSLEISQMGRNKLAEGQTASDQQRNRYTK